MSDSASLTFSHREAVLLTNASDEALHSWVKRGYVTPAVASTGRGKRRAYDQINLVQIALLHTLSQAGIDPSLAALVFERLRPLASDLIKRFSIEPLPSEEFKNDGESGPDRAYRTWLIDRHGMLCAEFTYGADGTLISNKPPHLMPLTAMWLSVDVLLNEWVLFPIEYDQAGRPQTIEAFEAWLDERVKAFNQALEPG